MTARTAYDAQFRPIPGDEWTPLSGKGRSTVLSVTADKVEYSTVTTYGTDIWNGSLTDWTQRSGGTYTPAVSVFSEATPREQDRTPPNGWRWREEIPGVVNYAIVERIEAPECYVGLNERGHVFIREGSTTQTKISPPVRGVRKTTVIGASLVEAIAFLHRAAHRTTPTIT